MRNYLYKLIIVSCIIIYFIVTLIEDFGFSEDSVALSHYLLGITVVIETLRKYTKWNNLKTLSIFIMLEHIIYICMYQFKRIDTLSLILYLTTGLIIYVISVHNIIKLKQKKVNTDILIYSLLSIIYILLGIISNFKTIIMFDLNSPY
jgi:predicted MFS family arabinose efflux permease